MTKAEKTLKAPAKKRYSKPKLEPFGSLAKATRTDPGAISGADYIQGVDLWGDPS